MEVPSLNEQWKCFELVAAMIAIFRYKQIIKIVETMILS